MTPGGRIAALDRIRGLSILGILFVNAIAFAQPYDVYSNPTLSPVPLSSADMATWLATEVFGTGKFVAMFSMLFGISVYLVGRAPPPAPFFRTPLFRRLGWLAVFGVIHGALIWHGDILLLYAVCGFVMWRWRHTEARKLMMWGSGLILIGTAIVLAPMLYVSPGEAPRLGDIAGMVTAMRGGFWSSLNGNLWTWSADLSATFTFLPRTVGLMMLGLGLFKSGVLKGEAPARLYAGIVAAALLSLCLIAVQTGVIIRSGFAFPDAFGLDQIVNDLLCVVVALGYASAVILAGRSRLGGILLHPLACAGRMAFSNYLCQSLIMTMIFYGGRGLFFKAPGLFGTMNHAGLLPIVLCVCAGQLLFSTLWLRWFRYGPFEWLWRCLTYRRWLRFFV